GIADIERLSGSGEEEDGERGGEEEKSLTGYPARLSLLLIFFVLSGKIKICIQENLVLQEHFFVIAELIFPECRF
ncbi:MAG: hypothetical protein NC420_06000, partial [Eubacterium sp.]|nr:hypothetical protein [Eubacterium sp.]